MAKGADIGSKRLISLAPQAWVRWLLGDPRVEVIDFLSGDFQWVSRETDVLIRVKREDIGEFLVLNELQLRYHAELPRRMRAYAALAEERYGLPTFPVLVNILSPRETMEIPNQYRREFLGLVAQQDYRVVNLWEVDAGRVLADRLLPLMPFVPIMNGGRDEAVFKQALMEIRAEPSLEGLDQLLAFFASFVLAIPIIQKLMRWDMTVLRESPWYEEIHERGLKQGLVQGRRQAAEAHLIRILTHRLGAAPAEGLALLKRLSLDQLEALFDIALEAKTWGEFLAQAPTQGIDVEHSAN